MLDRIAANICAEDISALPAQNTSETVSGLMVGTRVATTLGWRSVDAIAVGDQVLTFDAGLQRVAKVSRFKLWEDDTECPIDFWPVNVPAGALGNRKPMQVLPGQSVLVESDTAEMLYGDPFALIPGSALIGTRGADRFQPAPYMDVVVLQFDSDQVIFSEDGALFFCAASCDLADYSADLAETTYYSILPMDEARFLAVQIEDETAAVSAFNPQDVWAAATLA